MDKKDRLICDTHIDVVMRILDEWSKGKKGNQKLNQVIESFWQISFYISKLTNGLLDAQLEASDLKYKHNILKLKYRELENKLKSLQDELH
jgi:transposase InsO family protein